MAVITPWVAYQATPDPPPWFRGQLRNWRVRRQWAGAGYQYHTGQRGRVACYASREAAERVASNLNQLNVQAVRT